MGVNRVIDPSWVAGLGVIIFSIGLWGAFTRKNAIIVLMCIELIQMPLISISWLVLLTMEMNRDGCMLHSQ